MDAINYKVRHEGQIVNKAAYVVLGVNVEGYKDILGI
ncbi:transposase [Alkaliphilus metalliredigens]